MGRKHHDDTKQARLRLAARLHRAAKRRELTDQEVADELRVQLVTVKAWFSGKRGPIRTTQVDAVQTAIRVWNAEARENGHARPEPEPHVAVEAPRRVDGDAGPAVERAGTGRVEAKGEREEGRRTSYAAGYRDGYRAGFADGRPREEARRG